MHGSHRDPDISGWEDREIQNLAWHLPSSFRLREPRYV